MLKKKEVLIVFILAVLATLGLSGVDFGIGNTVFQPKYLTRGFGFPLSWNYMGSCLGFACNVDYYAFPFIFNLLFWFLVLVGMRWVYRRFKKKGHKL